MSKDEATIEAEIQAKGLTAPRLTPQKLDETIRDEKACHVFPGAIMYYIPIPEDRRMTTVLPQA